LCRSARIRRKRRRRKEKAPRVPPEAKPAEGGARRCRRILLQVLTAKSVVPTRNLLKNTAFPTQLRIRR
jgi:hypothetical protein